MISKKEQALIKRILNENLGLFFDKKDLDDYQNNPPVLSKVIAMLHVKLNYYEKEKNTIEKLEKKLWKKYYDLTGLKHPHELFDGIEMTKDNKFMKIVNDTKYNNFYFANIINNSTKAYWGYAADIIIQRGYPKIEEVIPDLFVWLQDMNWPGSYDLYCFLCTLPKEVIWKYFEQGVKKAYITKDDSWLHSFRQLMLHFGFEKKDFKEKELFEVLNREIEY